jgi:hypothetical protein
MGMRVGGGGAEIEDPEGWSSRKSLAITHTALASQPFYFSKETIQDGWALPEFYQTFEAAPKNSGENGIRRSEFKFLSLLSQCFYN